MKKSKENLLYILYYFYIFLEDCVGHSGAMMLILVTQD
jgi:hypothetical protein